MNTKSQGEAGTGCLYLVATPIGNLEDITLRAVRILNEAYVIACEDTRQTQKLRQHYGIRKEMLSYHEHNELTRSPELVIELEQGAKMALGSDAGTPGISDPGHRLVTLCLRHHIPVVPIPGPSALVAALAASGLPTEEFLFIGFLPPRAGARRKALDALKAESRTRIFYEAPHRVVETRPPWRNYAAARAGRSAGATSGTQRVPQGARRATRSRGRHRSKSGPQTSRARTRAGQARGVQTTVAGTLEFCPEKYQARRERQNLNLRFEI